MKKTIIFFLLSVIPYFSFAQKKTKMEKPTSFSSYHFQIKWLNQDKGLNLMCVNSGKKLMLKDTCYPDSSNSCSFKLEKSKYLKGLYTIIKSSEQQDRSKDVYLSVILDEDSLIQFEVSPQQEINVKKSEQNKIFYNYLNTLKVFYEKSQELGQRHENNKNASADERNKQLDSIRIVENEINNISEQYNKKYPNHILFILNTLQKKLIDFQNPITELDIKKNGANTFFNSLYLQDERTIRTPQFYDLIDVYTNKMATPHPDSIYQNVILKILEKINPNNFKDIVIYFSEKYGIERIPFQNAEKIFIKIFDNYIKNKQVLFDNNFYFYAKNRVEAFQRTLNGNIAPDFQLLDLEGKKTNLHSIKNKYTLLVFWDPNCVHCKKTIPILNSMVNGGDLANKDIQLLGVKTDGTKNELEVFIKEKNLMNWIHLEDNAEFRNEMSKQGITGYRQLYGVNLTPLIYLLDKDKKIIAKYLTPNDIKQYVE